MVKKNFANDQERQNYINKLGVVIRKHRKDLPFVDFCSNYVPVKIINKIGSDVKSWFSIDETPNKPRQNNADFQLPIDPPFEARKTIRIDLYPNFDQQLILDKWFYAYTDMFNASIRIIRSKLFLYKNKLNMRIVKFQHLRTVFMLDIKTNIMNNSISNNNIKTKIPPHVLDMAIQNACVCYKSHISNYKNGNIKKITKVRYWCFNRRIKTINLVKDAFSNKGLAALGILDAWYNNEQFDLAKIKKDKTYNVDPTLQYNSKTNRYYLYLAIKQDIIQNNNPKKIISLDPGIRTFMTGVTESNGVEIGKDAQLKIKTLLRRIDKINKLKDENIKLRKTPRNDNERKNMIKIWRQNKLDLHRRKISQYADELHWKTIRYLTKNYKNIIIGDMSVQGISRKNGFLPKITKRIGYSLKFYQFKQRLAYKCGINKIGYKEVDESYTSKLCSKCGNEHKLLGRLKVYCCIRCGMLIDRDINGARNIYIKSKVLE